VPIRLLVQGRIYRDMVDMTPSEATPCSSKTGKIQYLAFFSGHYLDAYREAAEKAKNIICVTLSPG
jgi:fatty acid-binding protein DegV